MMPGGNWDEYMAPRVEALMILQKLVRTPGRDMPGIDWKHPSFTGQASKPSRLQSSWVIDFFSVVG
jgi:hypothetical protein